jgi:hypothetical protein
MSAFTSQMETALAAPVATVFGAVEILLPGYAIRLLDGAGQVTFGGHSFTGFDPTFGAIESMDVISDGTGDEAPAISLTLIPSGDAAAGTLAAASMQGSQVSLWIGAVDAVSGLVIPDPMLVFLGAIDVPVLTSSSEGRTLELSVVSAFEKFFADDEGVRLSDTLHRSIWPGETGLAGVTGVDKKVYWGVETPISSVSYGSGTGIGPRAIEDLIRAL